MPPLATWEQFYDTDRVLDALQLPANSRCVVEFGCGYGTFTLAAATRIEGVVRSVDIERDMVDAVRTRALARGLDNVQVQHRDFVADGTGLPDGCSDYVMLFNILHHERPAELLNEALRVLRHGGGLGILHWNHDDTTPRGPPMAVRPTPDQCLGWALEAGFESVSGEINLPPFHYGLFLQKPT